MSEFFGIKILVNSENCQQRLREKEGLGFHVPGAANRAGRRIIGGFEKNIMRLEQLVCS
jgi:hypothetical protein